MVKWMKEKIENFITDLQTIKKESNKNSKTEKYMKFKIQCIVFVGRLHTQLQRGDYELELGQKYIVKLKREMDRKYRI